MNSKNKVIDWVKFYILMIAVIVYMYAFFVKKANIAFTMNLSLTVLGILMYGRKMNKGIFILYIATLFNSFNGGISVDLGIYTLGFIGWIIVNKKTNKTDFKPIQLKLVFRLILWGIVVTTVLAMANASIELNTGTLTILTSMYIVIPTLVTMTTVLGLIDMYLMRLLEQGILLYIYYMQMSLGEFDVINIVISVLMVVVIIVGYIDYIYYKKLEK